MKFMKTNKTLAVAVIVLGVGINLIDAYFSGNLPFSPDNSDQNNKLSILNRLGQSAAENKVSLGTIMAIAGVTFFLYLHFKKTVRTHA